MTHPHHCGDAAEATLMRLLYEHAAACWVSEDTNVLRNTNYVIGNTHKELYFRTRAVVLYDRVRDHLNGSKRHPEPMAGPRKGDACQ